MANVAPPRFLRAPAPGGEEDFGPVLREAFGRRQDRMPHWLDHLLSRLRGGR